MARIDYTIVFTPDADEDYQELPAFYRAAVKDGINEYLVRQPTECSKSRIKQLRGMILPRYRLRVGEIRIFYAVSETEVVILGIVKKSEAEEWLREKGIEQ